jgi:hypothetical protein
MLRQLIEHVRSLQPCSSADIVVSHTPSGTLFNFRRAHRASSHTSPLAFLRYTPFGVQGFHASTGDPYIRAGRIILGSTPDPVLISGAGMGLEEGDTSMLVSVAGGSAAAPVYIYAWMRPDSTSGLAVMSTYPLPTELEWRHCLYSAYRSGEAEVVVAAVHHVGDIVRRDEVELTVCIDGDEQTRTFFVKPTDV